MEKYIPPFSLTNTMLEDVSVIMESIGKWNHCNHLDKMPKLRKNNRIHSIHSSLAIEANSLSLNQVEDVIDGKLVIGPKQEIQEVKNAYEAYLLMEKVNPYSLEDLKKVHGIMMYLTLQNAGEFRTCKEGVFDGETCIFMAPGPEFVNSLMKELFDWINQNKNRIHPLILSSVFHYEFVFIHPFSDGNGRMARLWQNVILSSWKNIFAYLPIESQIQKYQSEYYKAINDSNQNGNSNAFIEFMLKMIKEVVIENTSDNLVFGNTYICKLLDIMEDNVPISANDLMERLHLKSKKSFKKTYLDPAIQNHFIKMTIPDKPTSKNQMYYKEK